MLENVTNPLHCPVRLYEFYLSRWWETHKHTQSNITLWEASLENRTSICSVLLLRNSPEGEKKRSDVFYLQPEENVHTDRSESVLYCNKDFLCALLRIMIYPVLISDLNSPHWYTSQPLEDSTLQSMLTRILAVREVQQEEEAARRQSSAAVNNNSLW